MLSGVGTKKHLASSSTAAITLFLSDSGRKERTLNHGSRKHDLSMRSATSGSVYRLFRSVKTAFFSDFLRRESEGALARCLQVSL